MKTRSITRQAVAIILIAQLLCAILLAITSLLHERHTRLRALQTQIAGRSDSLLGAIQDAEDPEDNITIDPTELRLPPADRYAVYSNTGKLIGRSTQDATQLTAAGYPGFSNLRIGRDQFTVYRRTALRIIDRAENNGIGLRRPVIIVYAASQHRVMHEVFEGVGFFLAAISIVALLSCVLTVIMLRRTLRPIRDLSAAAQHISPATLLFHAPASALQVDELRPLANILANIIDNLREAFAHQQRFVGDAAHELKTAVAVVHSSAQVLLMRQRTPAEYQAGLHQLLLDNDRVESLTTRMLDLARIEQSQTTYAPLLDLSRAAEQARETMRSIASAAEVELHLETASSVRTHLEPDRAQTLLTNLLSNAIRHSHPSSAVTIATQRIGNHAELRVIDTGSGIRTEALPHVFERFYRDDPSRSRQSGGTGLGLAICKAIVDAANGSIHIESKSGQGTHVLVRFPLA